MKSVIRQAKTVEEAVEEALKILDIDRSSAEIEVLEEPESGFLGLFGAKDAVVRVTSKDEDPVSEIINEVFYEEEKKEPDTSKDLSSRDEATKEPDLKEPYKETDFVLKQEGQDEKLEKIEEIKEEVAEDKAKEESLEDKKEPVKVDYEGDKPVSFFLLEEILKGMGIDGEILYSITDESIEYEIIETEQRDTSIIIGKRGDTLNAIQYILSLAENKARGEYIRISLDISNYREKRKESLERLALNMARKAKSQNRNIKLEPMNGYERKIIHTALQDVEGIETYSTGKDPRRRLVIKVN